MENTNTNVQVSELCKQIRAKSGLSGQEFSKKLNLSHSACYQWETNRAKPTIQTVEKITKKFRKYAPEECKALTKECKRLHSKRMTRGSSEGLAAEKQQVLKEKFKDRRPYAKISTGINEVGVYDFGLTAEGYGIVLCAFIDPPDERCLFRRTYIRIDESGRQYIQKGGLRFYFDDAEYCAEEVKNMLKNVSI